MIDKIPARLIDGVYHVGTQPSRLCDWCRQCCFDPEEYVGCPGCEAWTRHKQQELARLEAYFLFLLSPEGRVH